MAKAKLVKPEVQPDVVLTLNRTEAEVLMVMVGHYSYGNEYCSPRKHTDAIYNALDSIGIECNSKKYTCERDNELHWENFKK